MFRQPRAVIFTPYGQRRQRRGLPRWLWLLLAGAALGVGGVLWVQERVLPPRLSAEASASLSESLAQAESERTRLRAELSTATLQLQAALEAKKSLSGELATQRSLVQRLQADVASVVDALPADPRDTPVAVRAARFAVAGGMLNYDIVLTRERAGSNPLAGLMQLVVTGEPAQRGATSLSSKPVPVSMGRVEILRGSVPLPEGFKPRQTTVQLLDRMAGKVLGTRVWLVK